MAMGPSNASASTIGAIRVSRYESSNLVPLAKHSVTTIDMPVIDRYRILVSATFRSDNHGTMALQRKTAAHPLS